MAHQLLTFKTFCRRGFDAILPPRCPVTGDNVGHNGAISPEAWKSLTFITSPYCAQCGTPFEHDILPDKLDARTLICANCSAQPPVFTRARSALVYDDHSRAVILAFKHGDKTHTVRALAPLMANRLAELNIQPNIPTILMPVPLHWRRLLKRRYNQSALLADAIAKQTGHNVWPDALKRTRHTPPQGHKKAKDRVTNVANAFMLNPRYTGQLNDKNIILVDDVFTTGATLNACAKTLLESGAEHVYILSLARAIKH